MRLHQVAIIGLVASGAVLAFAQDPVDDAALRASLETHGSALANDSSNIPPAELLKGLENRTASFKIPKSFDLCRNSDEIYEKVKKATLIMSSYALCGNCDKHHASPAGGFIISPDGLAVTNHHVLDQKNATSFAAFTSDGRLLKIQKILAADPVADVAVVQLDGRDLPYLPVAEKATLGARVWAMSHPAGHFYTLTSGIASRYSMSRSVPWLEITADYAAGSSGSPIVNDKGQVVGVVSMTNTIKYPNQERDVQMVRKICVPSSAIAKLAAAK